MADRPHLTEPKRSAQAEREARLARALRDNLHRRKDQLRNRQPSDTAAPTDDPSQLAREAKLP